MGLDFSIYVKNKKDADKYFKKYPKWANLEYVDNDKQIFWCCGRAMFNITSAVENYGKKDKNGNVLVRLGDLKKDFVDRYEKLRKINDIISWELWFDPVVYENRVLGAAEDKRYEYEEAKADFKDLSQYEGVSEHVIKIVREIDREHLQVLKRDIELRRLHGENFVEKVLDIEPRLEDIVYDAGYMASYLKLCRTIKYCLELFGEDYKIRVENSY